MNIFKRKTKKIPNKDTTSFYIFYHDQAYLNEITQTLRDKRFHFINLNELGLPEELIIQSLTPQENRAIFSEYLGLLLIKPQTDMVGFFTYSIPKKFSAGWAKETGVVNLFVPEIRFMDFENVPFDKNHLYAAELNNPKSKFPKEIEDIHQKFRVGDEIINTYGPYKGSFIVDKQDFITFQQWFLPVVVYVLNTYTIDQWGLENSLYSNSKYAGKDGEYLKLDRLRHGIGELLERCVAYYFAQKFMDNRKIKLNHYLYHCQKPKHYAEALKKAAVNNTVIVVFADQHEKKSLDKWLKNIITADIRNILVITFDKAIYVDLKNRALNVLFEERNALNSNQKIQIIIDILSYNVKICYSSLDTLWQETPATYFKNQGGDLFFPEDFLFQKDSSGHIVKNVNWFFVNKNTKAVTSFLNKHAYLLSDRDDTQQIYHIEPGKAIDKIAITIVPSEEDCCSTDDAQDAIAKNNTIIIVFANYNYLPVLENWLEAVRRIHIENFMIISLDENLHHYLQEKKIASLLRPCELDLGKLWIHRVDIILELLEKGYNIIHSDADAVWIKDPQPYLNQFSQDMIFSQGTYWPLDVHKKWQFVLCCGFFYIKSNKKTLDFIKRLAERVRLDKDDQVSCNRLLMEEGLSWNLPDDTYKLTFRDRDFICSTKCIFGKTDTLSTVLLPHVKFQRIAEPSDDVYIKHLISEKNSDDIMDILAKNGCKFI